MHIEMQEKKGYIGSCFFSKKLNSLMEEENKILINTHK